jgi:hypothetical protein
MTAAARAISAEDLSGRLAVPGPDDELKDLGDTIDDLLHPLETLSAPSAGSPPAPRTSCAPRWR